MSGGRKLKKPAGMCWKYWLRLHSVPIAARLGRWFGMSWAKLGDRCGREVLIAQARSNRRVQVVNAADHPLDVVFLDPPYAMARKWRQAEGDGQAGRGAGARLLEALAGAPRSEPDWTWNNPKQAVLDFVGEDPRFAIEEPPFPFNEGAISQRVTYWPSAYVKRLHGA